MGEPKRRKRTGNSSAILIVDDHPVVRMGMAQLIRQEPDLGPCVEADGIRPALEAIAESKPDIVVVDISLKGESGLELMKDIKARWPGLPMLVLSMHDESVYAERVLRAGASGYMMKQEATDRLVTAIRCVLSGRTYLSENMTEKLLYRFLSSTRPGTGAGSVGRLTDRELQVFELIGQGVRTQAIAERLHRSVKTVESHREHIKNKLGLKDADQLLRYAIKWTRSLSGA